MLLKTNNTKYFEESELIAACQRGHGPAMQQLYTRYIKKMKGMVCRYARTTFDIEDILQEGFVRVFTSIQTFNHQGSFEGWVRKIILNSAINYYRKHLKLNQESTWDEMSESEASVAAIADGMDTESLMILINQLPEGYRFVLNLFAIEGYSHKEIAQMLQISESTSSSQYHRAKQCLAKLITASEKDEDS